MGKLVLIKSADFLSEAVERVNILIDAPSISIDSNGSVTIVGHSETIAIYYTTDGTDPTSDSTLYSDSFIVTDGTTVKAIAKSDKGNFSAISSAYYSIYQDLEQAELTNARISNGYILQPTASAHVTYCDVQSYVGKQVKIYADPNDIVPLGATTVMYSGFFSSLELNTQCITGSGFTLEPGTESIKTVPQDAKYLAVLTEHPQAGGVSYFSAKISAKVLLYNSSPTE